MPGVHVGLDFENEAGKFRAPGRNFHARDHARPGRRRVRQEMVEQQLHAEIIQAAAEEDGCDFSRQHRLGGK